MRHFVKSTFPVQVCAFSWSAGCFTCRSLISGSGCCHPLREGRQEGNRRFHCSKGQESFQASGSAPFRQGASEKLLQSANIVLCFGLCGPLFPGKTGHRWTSVAPSSWSGGGSPASFHSNVLHSVSKRSASSRAGREQGPPTASRATKTMLCRSNSALS